MVRNVMDDWNYQRFPNRSSFRVYNPPDFGHGFKASSKSLCTSFTNAVHTVGKEYSHAYGVR